MLTYLLIFVACYGVIVAAMYLGQRRLLYPGATGGTAEAVRWAEAVTIETTDGERLHALHTAAAPGSPTILFFHGNADRADRYGFLANALAERGIGLLALSYRGYPGSTGSPTEDGLIADGLAAHDWLAERANGPVVLLGQSLGSGVAVAVAAERQVAGLVLLSAYDSVLELAQRRYFFLPVTPLLHDAFRSDVRIGAVVTTKLFIHGRRDSVVPLSRGEALFAKAPQPKQMVVLDSYGHNDIWTLDLVERVGRFAEEAVR